MKKKTIRRVFSLALSLMMILALCPVSAFAVTQDEIDALRAERDAVTAEREEKQAQVDALKEEKAGVLEQKAAMEERNEYTRQQIQLINDEIALYDEMIADKKQEVDAAKKLEDEQLERDAGSVGHDPAYLQSGRDAHHHGRCGRDHGKRPGAGGQIH